MAAAAAESASGGPLSEEANPTREEGAATKGAEGPPAGSSLSLRVRLPPESFLIQVPREASFSVLAETVRFGFPPRPLSEKEASPLNQVSNGESLLVVLKTAGIARAFTELCQNSPSKRASSSSQKTDLNSRPPGLNVVTLHSPRSVRRRQGTRADSAGEAEGASEKRRRRALRLGSSEEEVAENLVRLFTNKRSSEAEKAIRDAFSNALSRRYDESAAERRWAAVQGGAFSVRESAGGSRLDVTYRDVQARGAKSLIGETHVAMPRALVLLILNHVWRSGDEVARHNMRPYYLCQAQPAVFWNAVRFFGADFGECFKQFLEGPEAEGLLERRRQLSAKALENLKQKEEAEARRLERRLARESKALGGDKGASVVVEESPSLPSANAEEKAAAAPEQPQSPPSC